ncbi:MAG TPA: hypothetical protein VFW40_05770 [Capsulimonadaceae bacterium]|nr:hypothetical protein [Capsulimonadaceae bacterium]
MAMFDVKKHLIKVQGGRQYLPVAARLVWFREQHPDWGIETHPIAIDTEKQYAIFEASVYNAEGKLMAKGTKMENVKGFPDYIEKAETGSIGRALAVCGFGTQFAPELDETVNGRIVDSPQPIGGSRREAPSGGYSGSYGRNRESYAGGNRYGENPYGAAQNGNERAAPSERFHATAVREPEAAPSASAREERATEQKESAQNRHAVATTNPDPFAGEDLFETASQADAAKDAADQNACSACGKTLTTAQQNLSVRKYGVALCPTCQKERRGIEAG